MKLYQPQQGLQFLCNPEEDKVYIKSTIKALIKEGESFCKGDWDIADADKSNITITYQLVQSDQMIDTYHIATDFIYIEIMDNYTYVDNEKLTEDLLIRLNEGNPDMSIEEILNEYNEIGRIKKDKDMAQALGMFLYKYGLFSVTAVIKDNGDMLGSVTNTIPVTNKPVTTPAY